MICIHCLCASPELQMYPGIRVLRLPGVFSGPLPYDPLARSFFLDPGVPLLASIPPFRPDGIDGRARIMDDNRRQDQGSG